MTCNREGNRRSYRVSWQLGLVSCLQEGRPPYTALWPAAGKVTVGLTSSLSDWSVWSAASHYVITCSWEGNCRRLGLIWSPLSMKVCSVFTLHYALQLWEGNRRFVWMTGSVLHFPSLQTFLSLLEHCIFIPRPCRDCGEMWSTFWKDWNSVYVSVQMSILANDACAHLC